MVLTPSLLENRRAIQGGSKNQARAFGNQDEVSLPFRETRMTFWRTPVYIVCALSEEVEAAAL